ncbi:MAG: hypothetical protein HY063_04165 [Bacteroidetes bacterium]|nr:hypothetical protein [Bacteroidota bacterium]
MLQTSAGKATLDGFTSGTKMWFREATILPLKHGGQTPFTQPVAVTIP